MKLLFCTLAAATALVILGCGAADPIPALPESSVLMSRGSVALVRVEYARLHEEPDVSSPIRFHARSGEILSVKERTPDQQWLRVEMLPLHGWVHRDDADLFDNRAQARDARERENR